MLLLLWLVSCHVAHGDAPVQLDIQADRDQVYLGDSFTLTVRVSGVEPEAEPDLSALTNCTTRAKPSLNRTHQRIVLENGEFKRVHHKGRLFTYDVTPSAAGAFRAGPIALALADGRVTAKGPTIRVIGREPQDIAMVRLRTTPDRVLAGESFEVILTVALKQMPPPYADNDPIDPGAPPHVQADYLNGQAMPGLQVPDMRAVWESRLLGKKPRFGFAVNEYSLLQDPLNRGPMQGTDALTQESPASFRFDRQPATINGQDYFEYTVAVTYRAKQEGDYTFGPAVLKGPIVTRILSGRRRDTLPVLTSASAQTVEVVPPPVEGRPSSYFGAVGSTLTAAALLDTQTCDLGDPLTLTLRLSGDFSTENVAAPTLREQDTIARRFRLYDEAVQTDVSKHHVEYRYTIRPTEAGTYEVPPIHASYYDPKARTYRTVATRPLPIRVNATATVGGNTIARSEPYTSGSAATRNHDGPRVAAPFDVGPAGAEPVRVFGRRAHIAWAAGAPLVYVCVLLVQRARRRSQASSGDRRQRRAAAHADAALAHAAHTRSLTPDQARRSVYLILRRYLADRFLTPKAGLTPADARALLHEHLGNPFLADQTADLLERNFNSGFAGTAAAQADHPDGDIATARRLVRSIEGALHRKTRT